MATILLRGRIHLGRAAPPPQTDNDPQELRARAMNDQVVKAMLEVFPAEIGEVEKID